MNCLVTGAAGFIGSHLAGRLVEEGHEVVGIDCFTDYYPRSKKERNLLQLKSRAQFHFIEADLLDADIKALLRGELPNSVQMVGRIDWVFHVAAQAGVRSSWGSRFDVYTHNNVLATQRLLEAVKGVSLKKFVYASSSSVYGDAECLPTPESVTPGPISPYGVTKLAGEHLCSLYQHNYGVPTVCLRYFTVYGPRQRPDMAFHRFITAALEGRDIVIYGDGEQTRDFTFVADTVEGTVRAAGAGAPGDVLNIGGGSRASVNQVLRELETSLGKRLRVCHVDAQAGDARHTAANIACAASKIGYAPRVPLADGLRAQVEFLRQEGMGL